MYFFIIYLFIKTLSTTITGAPRIVLAAAAVICNYLVYRLKLRVHKCRPVLTEVTSGL